MKKVLSQKEINAILGKASRPHTDSGRERRTVELCDFRNSGQLSEQHARTMKSLYEEFARSLSNSLGAYVRDKVDSNGEKKLIRTVRNVGYMIADE